MQDKTKTASLAERMKKPKTAQTAEPGAESVSRHFKTPGEEYTKRLTLDLTPAQHRKLKLYAMNNDTGMNQILRDFIDTLED